ncbi:serine/threonine-protein phosphatase Pgam5, mitochondrial [Asbolus verrucosus]|uniref:Serine/threonine-protein phosphatase PGAM5, mitochondrial n=1 Tax=Asbolus verrucosus TaxID=1661398 RepID=A0A482W617_ASBVE|nr:serine/threonine-protein phosphatase Pgam5, mitochondrial [Asbolus verrucosus]
MKPLTKFHKILLGVGAASGVVTYYCLNNNSNKKVYASWTTSYEPSKHAKWNENWDHRSPKHCVKPRYAKDEKEQNKINKEIELNKAKSVRHIILIRHGQYNVNGQSDEQRTLTKLGKIQAGYTGKRLKELGFPYSNLIKSTMSRAQETGTIISNSLPDVPVLNCDLLREGAPIPPEPPVGSWKQEMHKFYTDGARIEAAFRKYFHRASPQQLEDSYTVLVCHANVIRYFVCRALQFPGEAWLRMSLNHGSITWISITPSGRVVLRCLGDSGHMPPDVITSR